jgi:hypothetical protein
LRGKAAVVGVVGFDLLVIAIGDDEDVWFPCSGDGESNIEGVGDYLR